MEDYKQLDLIIARSRWVDVSDILIEMGYTVLSPESDSVRTKVHIFTKNGVMHVSKHELKTHFEKNIMLHPVAGVKKTFGDYINDIKACATNPYFVWFVSETSNMMTFNLGNSHKLTLEMLSNPEVQAAMKAFLERYASNTDALKMYCPDYLFYDEDAKTIKIADISDIWYSNKFPEYNIYLYPVDLGTEFILYSFKMPLTQEQNAAVFACKQLSRQQSTIMRQQFMVLPVESLLTT